MISLQEPSDVRLLRHLSLASKGTARDYLSAARETLESLVARPGLLDGIPLQRRPGGYERNLIYGDDDISVLAMVWAEGARTSIHDHHCSCCFGVLLGAIEEVRFKTLDEAQAVPTMQATRGPGFVACLLPTGPNIHQMINTGMGDAVSLHIYGYDHHLHASSIEREYRLAAL
ncbi:cysteine dioxygenase family protein [Aquabacter sp. CN5-332]|uniref:cysteine dioxygenase family protein n=1 Tax=Aquabacter sp. CN5-332 TaxID=3156608 RepID=UPI0032B35404